MGIVPTLKGFPSLGGSMKSNRGTATVPTRVFCLWLVTGIFLALFLLGCATDENVQEKVNGNEFLESKIPPSPLKEGEGFQYESTVDGGTRDAPRVYEMVFHHRDQDGRYHFSNGTVLDPTMSVVRTEAVVASPHMGNQRVDKNESGDTWKVSYYQGRAGMVDRYYFTRECTVTAIDPTFTVRAGSFPAKRVECSRWVNGKNYATVAYYDLRTGMLLRFSSQTSNETGVYEEAIKKINPS